MKAVLLKAYGGIDQLSYEEVETPKPGAGEVLVKIAATSVNPIDLKMRIGAAQQMFPVEFPAVLGRDLAGEVAELGAGATGFSVGQRVMALANRTYAEYAVVKANELTSIPEGLTFEQAASLPLVTLTGAQLIERGVKAKAGQSVLITGALGMVGRAAVYVSARHHAQVIAGVRTSQLDDAEFLGTLAVVSLEDEEAMAIFADIDAVADTVGGQTAAQTLKHLRHGGLFVSVVGVPDDAKIPEIYSERITAQPDGARLQQLARDAASKRLVIPIARVMKLEEIREAHQLAERRGANGKIVLTL